MIRKLAALSVFALIAAPAFAENDTGRESATPGDSAQTVISAGDHANRGFGRS